MKRKEKWWVWRLEEGRICYWAWRTRSLLKGAGRPSDGAKMVQIVVTYDDGKRPKRKAKP